MSEQKPVAVKSLRWMPNLPRGQRATGRGLVNYCIAYYGGDVGEPIYRWAREAGPWSEPFAT